MLENFLNKIKQQIQEPKNVDAAEQKKPKTPEYSDREQEVVTEIDERINGSEEFFAGLGRVAKKEIFLTNTEALEEIYKPVQLEQRIGMDEYYDYQAFKLGGGGLRVRNAIKRSLTFGMVGSKYALEGEHGLADTRKVKDDIKNRMFGLGEGELRELAKKLGLRPDEINPYDYAKSYGEKKGKKTMYKRKSEQEEDKIAGDILEKRLKELETNVGPALVKKKEGLEDYMKKKADILGTIDDADEKQKIIDKIEGEEIDRKSLIQDEQESLNRELEEMRTPLEQSKQNFEKTLESFSGLLAKIVDQEKQYSEEIKKLQKKLDTVKRAKEFAEVMKEKTDEWQEQKEQIEANQKAFKQEKEKLVKRVDEIKKVKIEVDKTLNRVNGIGKTRQEAREERAAKEKERVAREKEREEEEKKKKKKATASQPPEQWDEITGFEKGRVVKHFIKRESPYEGLDVANPAPEQDDSGDEAEQNIVEQAVAAPTAPDKRKKREPMTKKKIEAAPPVQPKVEAGLEEASAGAAAPEKVVNQGKESKEKIKLSVKEWLNILGLSNQTEEKIKKIINDVFSINDEADANAKKMTFPQALHAYKYYLVDAQFKGEKYAVTKAETIANRKFIEILKNL